MNRQSYLIALGGNHATSQAIIASLMVAGSCDAGNWPALQAIAAPAFAGATLVGCSRIHTTEPLGPGRRRYANAVVLVETDLDPPSLLDALKSIERAFGRRRGRRWGDRPLDLDIIGWSRGIWASPGLTVPHVSFRERRFVLAPLTEIAPGWRDPVTGLSARQLLARLDRKRPRP